MKEAIEELIKSLKIRSQNFDKTANGLESTNGNDCNFFRGKSEAVNDVIDDLTNLLKETE